MEKNKQSHSIKWIVFVILLFILIVILLYVIQLVKMPHASGNPTLLPTEALTDTLKIQTYTIDNNTYHSFEYGLSFSIPDNWHALASDSHHINLRKNDNEIPSMSGFTLYMEKNPENMTFKQWFEEHASNITFLIPANGDYSVEQEVIKETVWIKTSNIGVPPSHYLRYTLFHKGNIYYVVDTTANNENVIEQVLSTIVFDT